MYLGTEEQPDPDYGTALESARRARDAGKSKNIPEKTAKKEQVEKKPKKSESAEAPTVKPVTE